MSDLEILKRFLTSKTAKNVEIDANNITAGELIEILKQYPANTPIKFSADDAEML